MPTKRIKKPKKEIDLYDADHPFRRTAIDIIESVIEPLLQRGINGKQYYHLEDSITIAINERLKNHFKFTKLDNTNKKSRKIIDNDVLPDSDNDEWTQDEEKDSF